METLKYNLRKSISLLLFVFFIASFVACDVIDDEDKLIVDDKIPSKNIKNTVLLEDFTGVLCKNCPDAASVAHDIQDKLGSQLIIVSIHAGPYSSSAPEYQSEAGNSYLNKFYPAANEFPAGIISRKQVDGSLVHTNFKKWETYIMERLNSDIMGNRLFDFDMFPQFSEETNEIRIESTIKAYNNLSGVHLQLWITESGVVGNQLTNTEFKNDYIHNHMLRDAINGIWGEEIESMEEDSEKLLSNTYSLNDKEWDTNNLHIVGFIYDSKTMEVLQVLEKSLIEVEE
ncbi:Omp28 family outer membrane lipoprotein [Bacteroidales bacterium OttesenSCG-928-M11]|nr:Omp28 family outer membrane lipoprotein [Bacteroidales bacterium OttesenSCG-928-M11]